MRRRGVAVLVGCVTTAALVFSGSATAATVVGNGCTANTLAEEIDLVGLKNPAGSPLPAAIPSAGVITSWSLNLEPIAEPQVSFAAALKVFRRTDVPGRLRVVGESERRPVGIGVTTNTTRIPVESGDLLGNSFLASAGGESVTGTFFCETEDPGDEGAAVPGDPGVGAEVTITETATEVQNPITVSVEPDGDHDGYGDETQDKCPTDASTQGPCPTPPPVVSAPPITLSASAAAKEGVVTVTVTTSAQAGVTVAGGVKLGKGKTAKLSGGTQTVLPGTFARFTVLLPAKVKKALKHLPKSKKLPLSLSASAPGATTADLTVKVPGQKKIVHHHKK